MKIYPYSLDTQRPTRHFLCPECGKKEFVLYRNNDTSEYVSEQVGKCNRIVKCNYHYTPKQYFEDNRIVPTVHYQYKPIERNKPTTDYLPPTLVEESKRKYETNNFLKYLQGLFEKDITYSMVNRFQIGTSKHWQGATVFWQMDALGRVRTGKIMLYNPQTGKRVKEPYSHISWVHSVLIKNGTLANFNLEQCLFGEHQLRFEPKTKKIALVESEKTAVLASVLLPDVIWLAVGSLTNLSIERCEVLAGRNLILYPDLGVADRNGLTPHDKWTTKATFLEKQLACNVTVSNILEKNATTDNRQKGLDIADFLIRRDDCYGWVLTDDDYPHFWDTSIKSPQITQNNSLMP